MDFSNQAGEGMQQISKHDIIFLFLKRKNPLLLDK